MQTTWILIADETRGRIFEAPSRIGALTEREALVHPESRLKESDLGADAQGFRHAQNKAVQHRVEPRHSIKSQHARDFAKTVAQRLEQAAHAGEYRSLIIVAAPKFLGLLRKELKDELKKRISLELDRDITKLDAAQIRQHLPERLPVV